LGKTVAETVMMLKEAFRDEAMGITQVYEWFNHFKRGKTSAEDQLHCDHPSTSRTDQKLEKVHPAVFADPHQTIDKISEITGVSWSSYQCNLMEDSIMKQAAANFMPCLLTEEHKNNHVNVCHDLQEELKNDPESRQKSSQWE